MPPAPDQNPTAILLRKLESIAILTDGERQAVASLPMRVQSLGARQDILREGDESRHCCLILEGWACRYKLLSAGKRQIFSFHIVGDVPNLQSLHIPDADHNIATLTKARIGYIPHDSLRALTTNHPSVGALLWRDTLIEAAIFRAWMVGMGRRSAFEQIAHLFCEMYLKMQAVGLAEGYRCPMPITQADLADALGLTPVHINRVLKDMRGRAMITLKSDMLVLEAWNELIRVSEFDPTYLHLEARAAG